MPRQTADASPETLTRPDGKITREVVLAAALEIIGRDGADALSMHRLVAAPGSDAGRQMCNCNMARTGRHH